MDDSIRDPIHVHHPPDPGSSHRIKVVAAVVAREGRLLLTRRPPGGPLGLHWEFPGGKVEEGESPEHALAREIHEELGVHARPLDVIEVDTHDYPHGLGVEILNAETSDPTLGVTEWSWAGIEFPLMDAGVDFAVSRRLSLGPYAALSVASFTSMWKRPPGGPTASGSIEERTSHAWAQIGLRAAIKL